MLAMVMTLSPPIMAGIYTLVSLIGCDELKVPFYLSLCMIYRFGKTRLKNPIILWMGWTTITHKINSDDFFSKCETLLKRTICAQCGEIIFY